MTRKEKTKIPAAARPRDEWAYAEAADGSWRDYIVHMHEPRFIVRAVEIDPDGLPLDGEGEADLVTKPTRHLNSAFTEEQARKLAAIDYSDSYVLCEAVWIDALEPGDQELWMERTATWFHENRMNPFF